MGVRGRAAGAMPIWADMVPGLYGVEVWKRDDSTGDALSTGKGTVLRPTDKEMSCWWSENLGRWRGRSTPFTSCHVCWQHGGGELRGKIQTRNYKATHRECELKVDLLKVSPSDWASSEFSYVELGYKFFLMQQEAVREAVSNVEGLLSDEECHSLREKLQPRADKWLYNEQLRCDRRRKKLKAKLDRVWAEQEASPREYLRGRAKAPASDEEQPPAKRQKSGG